MDSDEDVSMDVDEDSSKKPIGKGDDLSQYNLDDYDEDEKTAGEHHTLFSPFNLIHLVEPGGPFSNIKGLTYYRDNKEDPYITLKEVRPLHPHSIQFINQ